MIISSPVVLLTTLAVLSIAENQQQPLLVSHGSDCPELGLAFASADSASGRPRCCPASTNFNGIECIPSECEDFEVLDREGNCVPFPEDECEDDEEPDEDGNCIPIPEDDCGDYDEPDKEGNCVPIPKDDCEDDEELDEDGNCVFIDNDDEEDEEDNYDEKERGYN